MLIYFTLIDTKEEKDKFEELYNSYKKTMFYVSNKILNDEYLSEEVVHQAFLKIVNNMDKIGEVKCQKTKGFIVTIAENTAKDYYRKRKRENLMSYDEIENYIKEVSEIDEYCENRIEEIILKLPQDYLSVIFLKFFQGYDYRQISEILNIKEENVRKRVSRAKAMLKEIIERDGNII